MAPISFSQQHGAMLLKYSGISFISGAVNHGFFSGERSLWTAAIGMVLFVLGAWLAHRLEGSQAASPNQSLGRTLLWGSLLSIGLGFFTGGLQHFPDSPARSAWVVPLGFALSVVALVLNDAVQVSRALVIYALGVGLMVCAGSWAAWQTFERHPQWAAGGHSHGDTHAAVPAALSTLTVTRSVDVRMDDQMRFTPSNIVVQAGETVRFVVHNAGLVTHEMVLGTQAEVQAHAALMRQAAEHGGHDGHGADHAHVAGTGAMVSVPAGATREWVVQFAQPATLQIACLVPGHYEAGMRGTLQVQEQGPQAPVPQVPSPNTHDHNSHKH